MTDIDPKTIRKAVDAIGPGSCNCREGHNQHGYWRQIDMTCSHCGDSEAKARAVLEAVADDLRAEGAAQALEGAADRLDLTGLERNSELSRWDYDDSSDFYEELVTEWLTAQSRADIIQQAWNGPNVSASAGTHAPQSSPIEAGQS